MNPQNTDELDKWNYLCLRPRNSILIPFNIGLFRSHLACLFRLHKVVLILNNICDAFILNNKPPFFRSVCSQSLRAWRHSVAWRLRTNQLNSQISSFLFKVLTAEYTLQWGPLQNKVAKHQQACVKRNHPAEHKKIQFSVYLLYLNEHICACIF